MDDNTMAVLKARLQFYQEENQRMKGMFEALSIMRSGSTGVARALELPQSGKGTFEVEKVHRKSNYVSKMKIATKAYKHENEKLSKEIAMWKTSLDKGDQQVTRLRSNPEDIMKLQKDVERYEENLAKLEKKYPWLQDPGFNLIDLQNDIKNLKTLRLTKDKLTEDLAKYEGLKPDLAEATQQLAELNQIAKEHCKLVSLI